MNGDRLHVISGRTVANGQTPRHDIYDPRIGAWIEGPTFPEARGGLAGALYGNVVIAGGGEIFEPGSVGSHSTNSIERWLGSVLNAMPTPRHGHGFIVLDDTLYALGGAERPSASGTLARVDAWSVGERLAGE